MTNPVASQQVALPADIKAVAVVVTRADRIVAAGIKAVVATNVAMKVRADIKARIHVVKAVVDTRGIAPVVKAVGIKAVTHVVKAGIKADRKVVAAGIKENQKEADTKADRKVVADIKAAILVVKAVGIKENQKAVDIKAAIPDVKAVGIKENQKVVDTKVAILVVKVVDTKADRKVVADIKAAILVVKAAGIKENQKAHIKAAILDVKAADTKAARKVVADIKAAILVVKAVAAATKAAAAVVTKDVLKAVATTVTKPDRILVDGHPSIANPQLDATIGIIRLTAMPAQIVNSAKVVAIGITEVVTINLKAVTTNLKVIANLVAATMVKAVRSLTKKKSIATKAVA